MNASRETFKGHALIVLHENPDDKYPVKLGLRKAKLILRNIKALKEFIAECEANGAK